jgi:dihydrofolate reductase/thymidylate synthase
MASPSLNAILGVSKNWGIGLRGTLPWKLRGDLAFFKQMTANYGITPEGRQNDLRNVVIMGRKTWDSLPPQFRPLKDRINVVITVSKKQSEILAQCKTPPARGDLVVMPDLQTSLQYVRSELSGKVPNIFAIGGQHIFEEALAMDSCKNVFLTRIGREFECDTFVKPEILDPFKLMNVSKSRAENGIPYDFAHFQRKGDDNGAQHIFAELDEEHEEYQYLRMLKNIIKNGHQKEDRTGVGTKSLFGQMMRFDLSTTFPLLTTKDVFWRGVVEELLWFIAGDTNGKHLSEKKVRIWEGNGSRAFLDSIGLKHREEHDLGPIYGFQWRHFGAKYENMHTDYTGKGVDQLAKLVDDLKRNRDSRRMILSAWNPADIPMMALPPCHVLSQYYVADGRLHCMLYQRSCDMGLGVPFNIASYALLTCMLAHVTGLTPGELVHVLGDTHVYLNHIGPLQEQIKRQPNCFPLLEIKRKVQSIDDFKFDDFKLVAYQPQSKIKMEMAV